MNNPPNPPLLVLAAILTLIVALGAPLASAQAETATASAEYKFGEYITFRATFETEKTVDLAVVVFQTRNQPRTTVEQAEITAIDKTNYQLVYRHDLSSNPLRAFSIVQYHFEVMLQDGEIEEIHGEDFIYADDRFEWQKRAEGPFILYWHEGDIQFAQDVLDTAQAGLKRLQSLLPYAIPDPTNIFVYPDSTTMQETLDPSSPGWVAGHADPDLGVIVLALPAGPDQYLLMEQRIPHELTHTALYQHTQSGYANLPAWLNEGLASLAELYPNPDYRILLDHALEKDNLLPISSLCEGFPRDASNALLAYAQADSFTRYLYHAYGSQGLEKLVQGYADGLDCEHGAKTALGKSLTQLERQWRSEVLSEDVTRAALGNLLPWFILITIVLGIPLGLGLWKRKEHGSNTD